MAMAEMQRAVTLAEKRALDSVTTERIRMERLLLEAASVSGVTGAMNVVSSRKPEMNILDAAINPDSLGKNEKMISERIKQDTEENTSAFRGMRKNESSITDEAIPTEKNKVCIDFLLYMNSILRSL